MSEMVQMNIRVEKPIKEVGKTLATRDGLSLSGWVRHQIIVTGRRVGLLPEVVGEEERGDVHSQ